MTQNGKILKEAMERLSNPKNAPVPSNKAGMMFMQNGGGLLSKSVTCSSCGHSWKSVDGGSDPLTCHNCGSMIEMANGGQMIRRADGSYSRRGMWDNIRENAGSGKKPTAAMLKQERKIRSQEKDDGGPIDPKTEDRPGFISSLIPSSVKSVGRYLAAVAGAPVGKMVDKSQFTKEQLKSIYGAAMAAQKRTGSNSGGTMYSDYGKAYAHPWGNGIMDKLAIPYKIATDPNYDNAMTLGRYTYNVNQDGSVDVSDQYNFNHDNTGAWYTKPVTWMDNKLKGDKRTQTKFKINPTDIKNYGGMKDYKEGGSIVDFLNKNKIDSSKTNRADLAKRLGIANYSFTAEQNTALINLLKSGKAPANTSTTTSNPTPATTSKNKSATTNKTSNAANSTNKKNDAKFKKPNNGYVDLQKEYNMNPFSKIGIEQAKMIQAQYPGTKFVCDAKGCAEIAGNAARAYGNEFGRANAWDYGNRSNVVYQNPDYEGEITGKQGALDNPDNYDVPEEILNAKGTLVGLNRNNNLVSDTGQRIPRALHGPALMMGKGKAKEKNHANDSYDYANPALYPNSRGYEHVGYMLGDQQMLHGTGSGSGHPAFYVIDDLNNGVDLSGYGQYQPVEMMKPGNGLAKGLNAAKRFLGFNNGGTINKQNMHSIYDMMPHLAGGGTNNPGFEALPPYVQAKILSNMGFGGYHNPYMAGGGSTFSGNAFYGDGGMYPMYAEAGPVDPNGRWHGEWQDDPMLAEKYGYPAQGPSEDEMIAAQDAANVAANPMKGTKINVATPKALPGKKGQGSGSIVDFLNSQGAKSDFATRKAVAENVYGFGKYTGSAEQNKRLLAIMSGNGQSRRGDVGKGYNPNDGNMLRKGFDPSFDARQQFNSGVPAQGGVPAARQAAQSQQTSKRKPLFGQTADEFIAADPYFFAEESDGALVKALDAPFTWARNNGARVVMDQDPQALFELLSAGLLSRGLIGKTKTMPYNSRQIGASGRMAGQKALPGRSAPTGWSTASGLRSGQYPMKAEGGYVEGQEMDVTPEEMERLRQQGYQFEII